MIDPKSTAGVLLREHDNLEQALAYARRKASTLAAIHSGMACDYFAAANDLSKELDARACTCHPEDNPPRPCARQFALDACIHIHAARVGLK